MVKIKNLENVFKIFKFSTFCELIVGDAEKTIGKHFVEQCYPKEILVFQLALRLSHKMDREKLTLSGTVRPQF